MGATAYQITSLTIVYSTAYSGADQRKHQSSVSQALVWGIHRGLVNFPHKWPVTRKMFPFDDVIMSWYVCIAYKLWHLNICSLNCVPSICQQTIIPTGHLAIYIYIYNFDKKGWHHISYLWKNNEPNAKTKPARRKANRIIIGEQSYNNFITHTHTCYFFHGFQYKSYFEYPKQRYFPNVPAQAFCKQYS